MFIDRFPHTFSVMRSKKDEYGSPVTDEEGNIIYETVPLKKVIMIDEAPLRDNHGNFMTEEVLDINYGYRTSSLNTSRRADVVEATYKVDTPLFLTPLQTGDRLMLQDYDRRYYGEVVKKASFGMGSIVWYDEVEN